MSKTHSLGAATSTGAEGRDIRLTRPAPSASSRVAGPLSARSTITAAQIPSCGEIDRVEAIVAAATVGELEVSTHRDRGRRYCTRLRDPGHSCKLERSV